MKVVWAASAALVLVCACTSAPQPAPAKAAASKPAAQPVADGDKKVCRSEKVIGSMTPVQTCHTKDEWTAIRNKGAQGVKDAERSLRAAGANPGAN
jgi:hypothetical protein